MKIGVYLKCEYTSTARPVLSIAGCHIYIHVFVCVCLCVYVCVCRRWLLARTCYYCEYVCPIMKCEGTDTERPVLPIAGCHIYIHVFVCVCVCVCVCLSSTAAAAERDLSRPSQAAAAHVLVKLAWLGLAAAIKAH